MASFESSSDPSASVKLISHEGEAFSVPVEVAKMSALIRTMLSEDEDDSEEEREIPLPNVKAPILAKVIEFCKQHVAQPMTPFEKVMFWMLAQVCFNFSFLKKLYVVVVAF
jgi:exosome complex RNA-binding protein Rrp42 (RNase PH superfamily)